jgi:hypothetical protein
MIVVSYRRDASKAITRRIFDRLIQSFGKETVLRDIDNIPVGSDFRERIRSVLRESDILLVIVGPRWLGRAMAVVPELMIQLTSCALRSQRRWKRIYPQFRYSSAMRACPTS